MKNIGEFEALSDKAKVFDKWENILEYAETYSDIVQLFGYISEEEKVSVTQKTYFREELRSNIRMQMLEMLSPESQMNYLKNEDISEFFSVDNLIMKFPDHLKMEIIESRNLRNKLIDTLSSLSELISSLKSNEQIMRYLNSNEIEKPVKKSIVSRFEYKKKVEMLENDDVLKAMFSGKELKNDRLYIISSFSVDELIEYVRSDNEFLRNLNISYRDIWKKIEEKEEKCIEVAERIDEFNIEDIEKRGFIAQLKDNIKSKIDESKINPEYRNLLSMKINTHDKSAGRIYPDFNRDLNDYRGLDENIYLDLFQLLDDGNYDIEKIKELCQICPNMKIDADSDLRISSVEEFLKAEEWFASVLSGIQEDWTDIQKLAYIDYSIGEKISYTPEYQTEVWVEDSELFDGSKSMNSVVNSEYGVCIGISKVEVYLLKRLGIDCEIIHTQNHAYVKVKDIDIPTKDGVVKGNTLVDPTWNLTAGRYKLRPGLFGKNYEQMRKIDIVNGHDTRCHKNDKLDNENLIGMNDEEVKAVFASIGYVRADGYFYGKELMDMVALVDEKSDNIIDCIEGRLVAISEYCPEFAGCIDSTSSILESIVFKETEGFQYEKCIINRVYKKSDGEKRANLFIYFELRDGKTIFYVADKDNGEFIKMTQLEFEQQYECYDTDKEKNNGKKYWEMNEKNTEAPSDSHEEL